MEAPVASATPEIVPAAAPLDAGAAAEIEAPQEYRYDDYFPRNGTIDVREWLASHGVAGAFREKACWDARDRVGVPPAPGLFCETSTSRPSRTTSRLFRLEGTRLRKVWEGVVATWTNWLELVPMLNDDGATLTVLERSVGSCQAAFAEFREKEMAGIRTDFGPVLREGCAGVGVYSWAGNRYAKKVAAGSQ